MFRAVVKVGGSIARHGRAALERLGKALAGVATAHRIMVVPGGWVFADAVRRAQQELSLTDESAHWMAVLAMNQYGLLLNEVIPRSSACESLEECYEASSGGKVPVLLPYRVVRLEDPLEHSWRATSDSIAAYVAARVRAELLVLAKDVDGIYDSSGRLVREVACADLEGRRTCVDPLLPLLVRRHRLECYVVNGLHPERVAGVIEGRSAICSRIVP